MENNIGEEVKINNIGLPRTKEALRKEFEELCRPLIKFLNDNYHPHVKAIVETDRCELLKGLMGIPIDDYILD